MSEASRQQQQWAAMKQAALIAQARPADVFEVLYNVVSTSGNRGEVARQLALRLGMSVEFADQLLDLPIAQFLIS